MSIRKGSMIISGNGGSGGDSLPPQAGNAGKFLSTNGSEPSWEAVGSTFDWVGTYSEWESGRNDGTIEDTWICYITDDNTSMPFTKQRTICETIFSLIPLTDPALHLLDGAIIEGTGLYNQFYTYMKRLYDDGTTECFTSESDWQTSVTTYGVCGKFVLDSSNQTIRLPKVTGFVEGTIDRNALGTLVEAGLPDITGRFYGVRDNSVSGAFAKVGGAKDIDAGTTYWANNVEFKASRSNAIYGNSTTVQPQTIKGFYYIVLATSVNLDISLDIDEVVNNVNKKADKDLVNTGYLTNCITEIPQDIKLELNNGTLTLKAGSKVYVPNGFEQDGTTKHFDEVIVQSDTSISSTWHNDTDFIWYDAISGNNYLRYFPTSICFSGSSAPSGFGNYALWYDTTNNIVKFTGNAGSNWYTTQSLPLGLVTGDGSKPTKIDQVFNGFGYIGNHTFILPKVKYLIPNGKNPDGTYKSIQVTVDNVKIHSLENEYSMHGIIEYTSGLCGWGNNQYYIQNTRPTNLTETHALWYDLRNNLLFFTVDNGSTWNQWMGITWGELLKTSSASNINSMEIKSVFRPVDMNEADYVVEFQRPTAQNNHRWYRLYKSGWIEQGGYIEPGTGVYEKTTVYLLKEMADVYYHSSCTIRWGGQTDWYSTSNPAAGQAVTDIAGPIADITTTSFSIQAFSAQSWKVEGMVKITS